MKKILVTMMMACMMIFSSVCMAADGLDLNQQQKTVETMLKSFGRGPAVTYATVSRGFAESLKNGVTAEQYDQVKEQVKEKFGTMKEAKFYVFQRFDEIDRVTYIASFSKEKIVSMIFAFDKQNKLLDFAFSPVQVPAEEAQKEAK